MTDFFKGNRYQRRPGQRMTEFTAIFEEGLERLRREGMCVGALQPTLGWFFLQHASLTPERRERALTALGLTESKQLVESAPKIVQKGIDPGKQEELTKKFEALGAVVAWE